MSCIFLANWSCLSAACRQFPLFVFRTLSCHCENVNFVPCHIFSKGCVCPKTFRRERAVIIFHRAKIENYLKPNSRFAWAKYVVHVWRFSAKPLSSLISLASIHGHSFVKNPFKFVCLKLKCLCEIRVFLMTISCFSECVLLVTISTCFVVTFRSGTCKF